MKKLYLTIIIALFLVASSFAVSAACNDGILNGDETDVDCGGSCSPCENCEEISLDSERDQCYIGYIVNGGKEDICDKIVDDFLKQSCEKMLTGTTGSSCPECNIQDTLEEGETKTYNSKGKDYEIEVLFITEDSSEVKLKINGEETTGLLSGQTYTLVDGSTLKILQVIQEETDPGDITKDLVEFGIIVKTQQIVYTCPECDITDTLMEGETKSYSAKGKDYEVKVLFITEDSSEVKFQINGQETGGLVAGQSYTLADNSILKILNVIQSGAGDVTNDLVEFGMDIYVPPSQEPTEELDDSTYLFVVEDDAPSSDIILMHNAIESLDLESPEAVVKLNREVGKNDLKNRVVTFVHEQKAVIIVGSTSPSEHVILAQKIETYLKGKGISTIQKISTEVTSDDLKDALTGVETTYTCPECDITDTLEEGASKNYNSNGKEFEVKVLFITEDSSEVKLSINGEETDGLLAGQSYTLADGSILKILEVVQEEENAGDITQDIVEFGIIVSSKPKYTCPECDIKDTLQEEESKTYSSKGKTLEVKLLFVTEDSSEAKFTVNGEESEGLLAGQIYAFKGGVILKVLDVIQSEAGDVTNDLVEFGLIVLDIEQCNSGCIKDDVCLPFGTRLDYNGASSYCDIDKTIKSQKIEDETCNNNYECSSNVCVNNKCISPNFIQKVLNWLSSLFS